MTNEVTMSYGSEALRFNFEQTPKIWNIHDPEQAIDGDIFQNRLNTFLSQTSLNIKQPVVVVSDKTRLCGYPQYLPILLDTLIEMGADENRISIYIAYGTHSPQSDVESREAYGNAFLRGQWHHHQCDDVTKSVELGRTFSGTPARVAARIMNASCLITFGAISHHYFAGYGGGRKLIFPGLGERQAIYANHGLFLDRSERRLAAGCRSGRIRGNPLAEDLAQIEAFRPADMAIHGILDSHGQVCDLLVGSGPKHFQAACARHGSHCEVKGAEYDVVLASCGGFPKDINFIQSHKAIDNAAAFVRDGGRLIVLAQCRDGIGSDTFLPWFGMGSFDAAFDRLAENYEGNGGTALSLMTKTRRISIALVTELSQESTELIGIQRLTADQAIEEVGTYKGQAAVIPNASMLVRQWSETPQP